jgi:hypothetical protein
MVIGKLGERFHKPLSRTGCGRERGIHSDLGRSCPSCLTSWRRRGL